MLRIIFVLLVNIFAFNSFIHSQSIKLIPIDRFHILDTAQFMVTYDVDIVNDPLKRKKLETDNIVLLIGRKFSKTYSQRIYLADSIYTVLLKRGSDYPSLTANIPKIEVFKNKNLQQIIVAERADNPDPVYLYEEPMINFNWKITNERKEILTYSCVKATMAFRGRIFEAWFAPLIPINDEPYKFCGLPGLILEIKDSTGDYAVKCTSFHKLRNGKLIKKFDIDYQTTTREELMSFMRKIYKNPVAYYKSYGIDFCTFKNGKAVPCPPDYSWPYNPIELE